MTFDNLAPNHRWKTIMPENKSTYDSASLPDLLPIYYKKLFPYGPYFKWLNYGGGRAWHKIIVFLGRIEVWV